MKTRKYKKYHIMLILGLILFLFTIISTSSAANTIYVNVTGGNDSNNGTSWDYAKSTLQNGIDTVDNNGLVNVAKGTYYEHLNIAKNVNLTGMTSDSDYYYSNWKEVNINGTDSGSVITISPGMIVNIANIAIFSGNATNGGGIKNYGDLTVTSCDIYNNRAQFGGGIYNQGNLLLNDCMISNWADNGGAIYNNGTCKVTGSEFRWNGAGQNGSVIYNANGITTMNFNSIYNNTAWNNAKIVYCENGSVIATNNWWGTNDLSTIPNLTGGNVTVNPYIVLSVNSTNNILRPGRTSIITSSLRYNSNGEDTLAKYGVYVPYEQIFFTATSGNISPADDNIYYGLNASSVFTAGNTTGNAIINLTVANQVCNTTIQIITDSDKTDVYVATDGSDNNGDGSQNNPYQSLAKAINEVMATGTIHIANGTYRGSNNRGLIINIDLTITGDNWRPGNGNSVIIDAEHMDRIFTINYGTYGARVTLQNLNLENGNKTKYDRYGNGEINNGIGGAIYNNGTLSVMNCTFTNNTVFGNSDINAGGAIVNLGTCTLENCNFTGNTVNNQGGVAIGGAIGSAGICTVTSSDFTSNSAMMGGAIANLFMPDKGGAGIFNIIGCTFTSNTANLMETYNDGFPGSGGAIINEGGTCTIESCMFTGNVVYSINENIPALGGAIGNTGNCTINGCNFTNNLANSTHDAFGGAILNYFFSEDQGPPIIGNCMINSCIFSGNTAKIAAGAIGNCGNCTVTNSILTGNNAMIGGALTNMNIFGIVGNCTLNYSCIYNNNAINGTAINCMIYNPTNDPATTGNLGTVNANYNWWGTNVNPMTVNNLIAISEGFSFIANPWVILSINANPTTINNGASSTITTDLNHINGGLPLTGGHVPDVLVTLTSVWGSFKNTSIMHSIVKNTVNGSMSSTFYAIEGAAPANHVMIAAAADGYTTNATESAYITINKVSNLTIEITSNNQNPHVGEIITITYKLSNVGLDTATDVTDTIQLPEDFVLISISGDPVWNYDPATRIITWTMSNVPVGDPFLYISGSFNQPGNYVFGSSISPVEITLHIQVPTPNPTHVIDISNTANAATTSINTVGMQNTGIPVSILILALLMVLGSLVPKRK